MIDVSTAQQKAVCHDCQLEHLVFSGQGYLDFRARHFGHRVSLFDRDWLGEQGNALAANDTRKKIVTGFGWLGAIAARLLGRDRSTAEHVEALRRRLSTLLPQAAPIIPRLSVEQLLELAASAPNADVKEAFATSTAFTQTLLSLASSATVGREGAAIDNSTSLYLDYLLRKQYKLLTGAPANDKAVHDYVVGSEDGTNFSGSSSTPDNFAGTDAAVTMGDPTNALWVGSTRCVTTGGLTFKSQPFSVAAGFNGFIPRKFSNYTRNYTGFAFTATEGDHLKFASGLFATVSG